MSIIFRSLAYRMKLMNLFTSVCTSFTSKKGRSLTLFSSLLIAGRSNSLLNEIQHRSIPKIWKLTRPGASMHLFNLFLRCFLQSSSLFKQYQADPNLTWTPEQLSLQQRFIFWFRLLLFSLFTWTVGLVRAWVWYGSSSTLCVWSLLLSWLEYWNE